MCWPFPGRQKGKWGNVVFVQIPTAEVYFPTQRYISRPQRCIFKLRPLGISHTTDQPGAKNLYSLLASKAGKWSRKIIERSGHWYPLQRFLQWMSTNKHSTKKETRSIDKPDCLNETMSHHQIVVWICFWDGNAVYHGNEKNKFLLLTCPRQGVF